MSLYDLKNNIFLNFVDDYNANGEGLAMIDYVDKHIDIDYLDMGNSFDCSEFIDYLPRLQEIYLEDNMSNVYELNMNKEAICLVADFAKKTILEKIKE